MSDRLERKIILILLLYDKNEEFEDVFLRTNAEGEIETVVENGNIKF
jgi:DNA primase